MTMTKSTSPVCSPASVLTLLLCGMCMLFSIDATSNVHIVYLGKKEQRHDPRLITDSHHNILASVVGSKKLASEMIVYSYKHGFSGFAAKLTESQRQKLAEFPGVVRVVPNTIYKLQTTRSWDFLGLSSASPINALSSSNLGDGVVIGVLDTGIWPESKAFSEERLGPIPSHWKGICESGDKFNATVHCNRKIVGARWFVDGFLAEYGQPIDTNGNFEFLSPRDANGHGTHTASTVAGALVGNVSYKGLARGTMRGGAPKARLAIYKVCWDVLGGQCSSADILKAFDEAIHDGVDVLSLSLGTSVPLFSDVDEHNGIAIGSFHAVSKGITVVCSAGNDGPLAQTVQNTPPWILTVAASTIDRVFPSRITLGNNKTFMGLSLFTGEEIGFRGLVYPQASGLDPNSAGVCEYLAIRGTSAAGKVVLCFTTVAHPSATTVAAEVVKAARGVGVIVAKNPSDGLYPCSDDFPCVEVDYEVGTKILFYIRSTSLPVVNLSPSKTLVGNSVLASVAYFSSRGPNSIAPAILKPDVAAPGVNILAATSPFDPFEDNGYTLHSGTSMAAPHIAGIVALLKSLHPGWSPAAIRSALVTTAWRNHPSGSVMFAEGSPQKPANPFDYGGGIVNPNGAADPGLVYDMSIDDYILYLCGMGYNNTAISSLTENSTACPVEEKSLSDINLPSITIPNLRNSTTITRTVTNIGISNSTYRAMIEPPPGVNITVNPSILVFKPETKKISFSLTVSATRYENSGYYFGSLTWTDGVHYVRSPISVRTETIPSYIYEN